MKLSVVMATYNRADLLAMVLESIRVQKPTFDYEVIVVDDGSQDDTKSICTFYSANYHFLDRPYYANPAKARNVGYRAALGDIVVAQSSDTYHVSTDALERLAFIEPGTFNIATVYALDEGGGITEQLTGARNQRPLFFLGSLLRTDLFAIGGDDEDFTELGCEDDWFADRLGRGRLLKPNYREDIVGRHQWHPRPSAHWEDRFPMALNKLHNKRMTAEATGRWLAPDAPWSLV